ncbi:hypothetical protein [uncultured Fibrobacter sp.]
MSIPRHRRFPLPPF